MNRRWFFSAGRTVLPSLLATAIVMPSTAFSQEATTPEIVVIGEVQGATDSVATLLEHLGLIDSDRRWSGGAATLIQTGDLMDRGEGVRATLDLFIRLQDEATAAGGQVIVLIGNHEAMNILGELRDVNYMAYQTFAGPDSEQRQQQGWEEWVEWKTGRAEAIGQKFVADDDIRADWFAQHPPGWMESEGVYGAWLRTLPIAVEIDNVLYIHAGISPEMKGTDVDSINRKAADEIAGFDQDRALMVSEGLCLPTSSAREMIGVIKDEINYLNTLDAAQRSRDNPRVVRLLEVQDLSEWGSWSVLTDKGPLWFRGTTKWTEKEHGAEMASILDASGFERMVTGQSNGKEHLIHARFSDRVLLPPIDMSDDPYAGGGKPAALAIDDGDYFVVTVTNRELLIDN
jgi:hypothetical protein